MKTMWKLLLALTALSLIAAACGDDDSVDQDAVDEILDDGGDGDDGDDGGDDGGDDSTDTADDSTDTADDSGDDSTDTADDSGDDSTDTADDSTDTADDGGEPEPAAPTDHCLILHHYQEPTLFPTAPYYVSIFTDMAIVEGDVVTVEFPGDTEYDLVVRPADGDFSGGFDIRFPVFGPGQVDLPVVSLNGVEIPLSSLYWEGNMHFVAAGAEIRDEEIYGAALPCTLEYMVMVEPPALSVG